MEASFNFVEIIEKNSEDFVSDRHKKKVWNKIKEYFTDNEQKLFVTYFYSYLKYDELTDFVINLDDVWKWLGFSQKIIAKNILEKHFIIEKNYKILQQDTNIKREGRGGHTKENIIMTLNTFKILCFRSNTQKSIEIFNYFLKLQEIMQKMLNEEHNELRNELKSILEEKKIIENEFEEEIIIENEYTKKDFDLLQSQYDLLKMENENLKQQLITNQPNNIIIEQSINKQIQKQLEEIKNQIVLQTLLTPPSSSEFIQTTTPIRVPLFSKTLSQINNIENQTKNILNNQKSPSILTGFQQPKQTLGPRLQKINPENLSLIHVYETVSEALNESNQRLKRPSIQKAINENTIYQGFRWAYLGREQDPNIVNIPPSRPVQIQNVGYIAKLNKEKTEIVNVYIDRKTASFQNGFQSASALDIPVKKDKPVNGFFYILFDKCSQELQNNFINNIGYPILYKDGVGQYDLSNNLIQEFICKYDCIKKLKISDKTLAKTLDKDIPYNNHYYRRLPEKIFC